MATSIFETKIKKIPNSELLNLLKEMDTGIYKGILKEIFSAYLSQQKKQYKNFIDTDMQQFLLHKYSKNFAADNPPKDIQLIFASIQSSIPKSYTPRDVYPLMAWAAMMLHNDATALTLLLTAHISHLLKVPSVVQYKKDAQNNQQKIKAYNNAVNTGIEQIKAIALKQL